MSWRSRVKAKLLIGLIVFSTVISSFAAALPVAADANSTLLDSARAWSVLKATVDFADKFKHTITKAEVDSCRFFRENVPIGAHVSTSGGEWNTTSPPTNTITLGLKAVGIASCGDLLTTIGYTVSGDTYTAPANRGVNDGLDHTDVLNKLNAKGVSSGLLGSDLASNKPSDLVSYIVLYRIMTDICGWQYRNPYVENDNSGTAEADRNKEAQKNAAAKNEGDTEGKHYHTYTYEDKKSGENTYYKQDGAQDDVFVGPGMAGIEEHGSSMSIDCADQSDDRFATPSGRLNSNHAYADAFASYILKHPDAKTGLENSSPEDASQQGKSTCGVKGGLGWMLCPVISFMADATDTMYSFIADQLEVEPELTSLVNSNNKETGTYTAWKIFRDYANVAFIIAFLVIVYSQVTSVGISNYGIKKMLPKLIIAAILVNISYFVCQFVVDITNLLGHSLKALLDGIAHKISADAIVPGSTGDGGGGGIATLIGTILVGGVVVLVVLSLGLLIPILLAVAMVFIILLIRKALIVILIVISPLAFVAYLLPNTEKLFQKWWSTFSRTLLVFPIVAVVVGGSSIASAIIYNTSSDASDGTATSVNKLIALGILTVPFFVIPSLLKKSLDAAGTLGTKVRGWGDKATGKVGRQAKEGYSKTSFAQGKKLREAGKEQYKRKRFAERVSGEKSIRGFATRRLAGGAPGLIPGRKLKDELLTGGASAGIANLNRSALATSSKEQREEVDEAIVEMSSKWTEQNKITEAGKAFSKAMNEGDTIKARAAQQILLNSGNKGIVQLRSEFSQLGQSSNYANVITSGTGQDVLSDLNRAGVKSKDAALARVAYENPTDNNGNVRNVDTFASDSRTFATLSDSELATQSTQNIRSAINNGGLDATRANAMLSNQGVNAALSGDNRIEVENHARTLQTPPSGPTPTPTPTPQGPRLSQQRMRPRSPQPPTNNNGSTP